ncbi:MAG: toprim domain-containing protein [Spirobacillus cienkowskii]|uniref:Toprim domain-containing protein n=1 Tax=Spirobacillus cienkowskii TaxID=495820 RepID=A0A369KLB6_9BACT|nr:MAG: toprim domain-containing protein [Spirobacillus cienkowskii]
MRLRKNSIQNLIQSISLHEHLKRYMEIKRTGNHAVAKCPFHPDSNPSLYIYEDNYHCFACKAHGTIIDYEMHRTGYGFREVVLQLSEQYNIHLEFEEAQPNEQKSNSNIEFFEKSNKLLDYMLEIFNKNFKNFHANIKNFNNIQLEKLIHFFLDSGIEIGFTGIHSESEPLKENEHIKSLIPEDLSERFAFPMYKENGKISGFAYSSKFTKIISDSNPNSIELLIHNISNTLQVITPFSKSTLSCLHWQKARTSASQTRELFITTNFCDFNTLKNLQIDNVIFCLHNKLDAFLLKILQKRVTTIYIVMTQNNYNFKFLWQIFNEITPFFDIIINFGFFPENPGDINSNNIKNWLNSKFSPVYLEVTEYFLKKSPAPDKLSIFKKHLLPIVLRNKNSSRSDFILNNIANKQFQSSKNIFFSYQNNLIKKYQEFSYTINSEISQKNDDLKPKNEPPTQNEAPELEKNNKLYKNIMQKTTVFYHNALLSEIPYAIEAREYLFDRGFNLDDIKKWLIGVCPINNLLSLKAENKAAPANTLLELGLIKNSKLNNRYYDFFYNRIIIPIFNHDNQVVALSGRVFSKKETSIKDIPKYINSPETQIFSKSNILFNFNKALQAIVSLGYVIVVEGYMDCITLVNHGITNTVAVMGTSLTHAHIDCLAKITKRIILCFDSDKAGQNAAKRSFVIGYPYLDIDLEYLSIPGEKDPDAFIKKYGHEEFLSLIPQSIPLLHQFCSWLFEEAQSNLEVFFKLIKEQILPVILQNKNFNCQEDSLTFLCDKYFQNLYPHDLRKEMAAVSTTHPKSYFPETQSKISAQTCENWPVHSVLEVKILLSLVFARFNELPIRLQNVAQGLTSQEEANERICAIALNKQMSEASFSILLELLSTMIENPCLSIIELETNMRPQMSHHANILIGYANAEAKLLFQYNLQELLKESLPAAVSMVSFKNIWDLKNSGFLRFQLRNIKLTSQRGILSAFIAETLLHLELEYIDNALKARSSVHFDHEIDKQFHDLAKERERRRKEFGSFESFNLQ